MTVEKLMDKDAFMAGNMSTSFISRPFREVRKKFPIHRSLSSDNPRNPVNGHADECELIDYCRSQVEDDEDSNHGEPICYFTPNDETECMRAMAPKDAPRKCETIRATASFYQTVEMCGWIQWRSIGSNQRAFCFEVRSQSIILVWGLCSSSGPSSLFSDLL